jgi:hypothetical protein
MEVGVCLDGCPHDPGSFDTDSTPTIMMSVALGVVLIVSMASGFLGMQRERTVRAAASWAQDATRPAVVPLRI